MKDEITRLAREYTQETADLKDYQCQARSAIYGRQLAKRWMDKNGYSIGTFIEHSECLPKEIEFEPCDPNDQTKYIWALVPEYNSYGHAKVILRRVGTEDGELLLPPEKRAEKRLKLSDREESILRFRTLKTITEKVKGYEAQIKTHRLRLSEQIKKDDKVYMEAEAIEIKRICDKMQEDLDDFLDFIAKS